MPITLTETLIATHERLYPRLAALLKQVERARPGAAVPEETVRLSRTLCREARKLLGREGQSITLPGGKAGKGAPLDHQGLAVALGQAVAGLEAFEAAHSGWSAERKCTVWMLDGPARPVLRLLPPGSAANPVTTRDRQRDGNRAFMIRLMLSRYAAGYDDGYRQASEGKPPSPDYAEDAWDGLVAKARGNDELARLRELKRLYGSVNPPPHLLPVGAVLRDPKMLRGAGKKN
ncbi:MAG: hypothetical protein J0I99_17840 [Devosia sp.]|uniref:hypothetical protein n=1 Tax=Devosia sp. TaxID=1871048 RepID=UPI001AC0FF3F|nr:hypothetical protein [Devosia sp.]MBN9317608.1 hypothetical protein [Devosia sp.]